MYCQNCKTDVEEDGGYCVRCGMSLNARMCSNGHVMDSSWTECRYCNPGSPQAGAGKGRTVIEPGGSPTHTPGGFVKGATLLEDGGPAFRVTKGRTAIEGRGSLSPASGSTNRDKQRTVFDPGGDSNQSGDVTVRVGRQSGPDSPLVGWIVNFDLDVYGVDFRLRAGRNVIGADASESDVLISGAPSVSSRHAVLIYRDSAFQLRDNDSTNGTYVNDKDIFGEGAVKVEDRDTLRFGEVSFVLHVI